MRKTTIGIMGPGEQASELEVASAFELGRAFAGEGYVLLTGGRNAGVMDAALRGAKSVGGTTVGVLPTTVTSSHSHYADIRIVTDMGSGRNYINVLSSDVVVACGMSRGTASEVCLALVRQKPVVLLHCPDSAEAFFRELGDGLVHRAGSVAAAVESVETLLDAVGA